MSHISPSRCISIAPTGQSTPLSNPCEIDATWRAQGMRWGALWSWSVALTRTRLPQLATLIPVLGYGVLWSDSFDGALMEFGVAFGSNNVLSPLARVQLLYFGSLTILAGLIVFWLLCPQVVRSGSRRAYLDEAAVRDDPNDAKTAANYLLSRELPGRFDQWTELHSVRLNPSNLTAIVGQPHAFEMTKAAHSAYYEAMDRSRPLASTITLLLLILGSGLFLLPSIEVFWMAMAKLAGI